MLVFFTSVGHVSTFTKVEHVSTFTRAGHVSTLLKLSTLVLFT